MNKILVDTASQALTTGQALTDGEKHRILVEWNNNQRPYPRVCVHQLIEEQVNRRPDAVAVIYHHQRLTYHELNARSNQLARLLLERRIGPDSLVGISMERSLEMVVGVLAVLKAGGACVPLDPSYPQERLAFMVADADISILLTQESLRERLQFPVKDSVRVKNIVCVDSDWKSISDRSADNIPCRAGIDNLLYVIYTSGSTGKPKGVALPHRTLTNLICWHLHQFKHDGAARVPQIASLNFDVAFQEIFSTLAAGGTLILSPENLLRDPACLMQLLRQQEITRLFLPTAALQKLAEVAGADMLANSLREVITAGEQLRISPAIIRLFENMPGCGFYNHYGPSESHVVTSYTLTGLPSLWPRLPSIGRPIANSTIYILDRHRQPVPVGVAGELYIGGHGVARGYLNRSELTAERFIPDPFSADPGARLYQTGDLASYLPDGNIEFLGRIDNQVKIRGFRIELEEIESVLATHQSVLAAAVAAREDTRGDARLVAYVVPRSEVSLPAEELRSFLKAKLPAYMVPARFEILKALPLTPTGKLDRQALPAPGTSRQKPAIASMAPTSQLEDRLARIFAELLELDWVGIDESFFDLGGDSLRAYALILRVEKMLGRKVSLTSLFEAPTVRELAALNSGLSSSKSVSGVVPVQPFGRRPPFFCVGGGPVLRPLAHRLGSDQPILGLITEESDLRDLPSPVKLQDFAHLLIRKVREVRPRGPYTLGGWCAGGAIAYEMAQQLSAEGDEVALLVLFETQNPAVPPRDSTVVNQKTLRTRIAKCGQKIRTVSAQFQRRGFTKQAAVYAFGGLAYKLVKLRHQLLYRVHRRRPLGRKVLEFVGQNQFLEYLYFEYRPQPYAGRVALFRAQPPEALHLADHDMGWSELTHGTVEVYEVPGREGEVFREPQVEVLARKLEDLLMEVQAAGTVNKVCAAVKPS